MANKMKKGLFIPQWIVELLDAEGQLYDGPGTCAAAAIYAFSRLKKRDKVKALQEYRHKEVSEAYADKAAAEIADSALHDAQEPQSETG